MPSFRADLDRIPVYRPGKPIDEVSRELGIAEIIKLASNEWPLEPFPSVAKAIADAVPELNRYPENSVYHLVNRLATHLDVPADHLWMGAGSTELLLGISLAVGGADKSFVFSDPSFVMYPISAAVSGSTAIPVPSTPGLAHDLDAMAAAIRDDTSLVFVCNPNNPTGTHLPIADVERFIESVPESVLVVVDEAYFEFVTDPAYGSAVHLAVERDNVVVTRTFSKVFGLAGLRVGYAIGNPETLGKLRRAQVPFSVNSVAQVAAEAALDSATDLDARVAMNEVERTRIEDGLAALEIDYVPSQTNFVLFKPDGDAAELSDRLLHRGVIVRPMGPYIRVTVGTQAENERLLEALAG